MSVSKRTRFEVLRRDNFTCQYCRSADGQLTVDHVIPVSLGGSGSPANLVAACRDCNAGKSSASPDATTVEAVSNSAFRWADYLKMSFERVVERLQEQNEYVDDFMEEWAQWTAPDQKPLPIPSDYRNGIVNWFRMEVPPEFLSEAIAVTMHKPGLKHADAYRYFCGVVWRMIDQAREGADTAHQEAGDDSDAYQHFQEVMGKHHDDGFLEGSAWSRAALGPADWFHRALCNVVEGTYSRTVEHLGWRL